jgi:hypothetical protein
VTETTVILVLVVITALGFDFTNGFHDTANAMATSIATNALRPKVAVALSGTLNLIGAFLSVEVALTVTNAVVKIQTSNGAPKESLTADGGTALLLIILAGLVGGIVWNLLTWLLGLPSSSSHALFGGLIGATVAGLGWAGVNWNGDGSKLDGVVGKVILPAVLSPVIAPGLVAPRLRAVHHARRDRLDPRLRGRQAGCAGPLAGGRPHGGRLADHATFGGDRRRDRVVPRRRHRRPRRRHRDLSGPAGAGRVHVPALAPYAGRPPQRQRRVGGRAGC